MDWLSLASVALPFPSGYHLHLQDYCCHLVITCICSITIAIWLPLASAALSRPSGYHLHLQHYRCHLVITCLCSITVVIWLSPASIALLLPSGHDFHLQHYNYHLVFQQLKVFQFLNCFRTAFNSSCLLESTTSCLCN